jgi:hypothetical protein
MTPSKQRLVDEPLDKGNARAEIARAVGQLTGQLSRHIADREGATA